MMLAADPEVPLINFNVLVDVAMELLFFGAQVSRMRRSNSLRRVSSTLALHGRQRWVTPR